MVNTLTDFFELQVDKSPDSIALVCNNEKLTYSELNNRSNMFAAVLASKGVVNGARVGILLDRSIEYVIAVIATLKVGGAYVPLPASYPESRLRYMIEDSGIDVLISESPNSSDLKLSGLCNIVINKSDLINEKKVSANPNYNSKQSDIAYVMYTSGTTGVPKGVMISHKAVINLVTAQTYADFGPGMRMLVHSPTAFDSSTFELWGPLTHGGMCVVYPGKNIDLILIDQLIREERVNCAWFTSSLFNHVVDHYPSIISNLAHVITGGESLSFKHVKQAIALSSNGKITNVYGPTETTTFACTYEVRRSETLNEGRIPIGKPINGVKIYIVDEKLNIVPTGTEGELLIGGAGVAEGYINKPELNAEKFIQDHLSGDIDKKLYRTGDRCRLRQDENIEFLGRLDEQIKVMGFRVELGGIEAVLQKHPFVSQACCLSIKEHDQIVGVVAHIIAKPESKPDSNLIRKYLQETLSPAEIPTQYFFHSEFPLTDSGKVNRLLLEKYAQKKSAYTLQKDGDNDELTIAICQIWRQILHYEQDVQDSDSFFDLGGDSLKVLLLVQRLESLIGRKLPVYLIYENNRGRRALGHAGERRTHLAAHSQHQDVARRLRQIPRISRNPGQRAITDRLATELTCRGLADQNSTGGPGALDGGRVNRRDVVRHGAGA